MSKYNEKQYAEFILLWIKKLAKTDAGISALIFANHYKSNKIKSV